MNNPNSFSNTLLQSSESTIPQSFSSQDSSSFMDKFKNMNWTTWLIIILILSFLGFNVFAYLAKGTEAVTGIFAPVLKFIAYITGQTVSVAAEGGKAVVGVAAEGGKAAINIAQGTAETTLDVVQNIATPETAKSSIKGNTIDEEHDVMKGIALNAQLNKAKQMAQTGENNYGADDSLSSIQGRGKAGWCYIGEDRGFRSCAKVGENDMCMSGDIFPTQEICMNPNLRS